MSRDAKRTEPACAPGGATVKLFTRVNAGSGRPWSLETYEGRPDVNDTLVSVRRVGAAWMVDGAQGLEPLLFLSGAKAEAQAHALARVIAKVGSDARVAIHDRAQQIVGTVRYFADDSPTSSGRPALPPEQAARQGPSQGGRTLRG